MTAEQRGNDSDPLSLTKFNRDSNQQHEASKTTAPYICQKPEKPERQQSIASCGSSNEIPTDSDRRDSTHDKQSYHSNHAKELAAESDTNSIMKPHNECQATSRRQVLTPTSPTSKEMVSGGAQDLKECATSWNEIVPGSSSADVASADSSCEVVSLDRKHANIEDLSSPQHSRAELLLSTANDHEDVAHIQVQKEQQLQQARVAVVNDGVDDSEDEMISPEARALITDEILKECQHSSSSFASSSASQDQESEAMQDSGIIKTDPPFSRSEKRPDSTNMPLNNHEDGASLLVTDRTLELAKNDVTTTTKSCLGEDLQEGDQDLHAASSERELTAKSSCIFVDMSSLNLDQVQDEEAND